MVGIPELNPQDKAERCLHESGAVHGIEEKRVSSPVFAPGPFDWIFSYLGFSCTLGERRSELESDVA